MADIRVVVILFLVSDARHDHDAPVIEDGHVHVADEIDVALGDSFLPGIRGGVVVRDDRFPLPDGLAPQSRRLQRVNERFVRYRALGHGLLRPGMHGENGFVLVREGEVADLALRERDGMFQREIGDLFQGPIGHVVQLQHGFQAVFVQPSLGDPLLQLGVRFLQRLFRPLAIRDVLPRDHRAHDRSAFVADRAGMAKHGESSAVPGLHQPFFVADDFAGEESAGERKILRVGRGSVGMKNLVIAKMIGPLDALELLARNAEQFPSIPAREANQYVRRIDEHEALGKIFDKGIETPPKFGQFFEELLLGLILVVHSGTACKLHCQNPPLSQNAAVLKRCRHSGVFREKAARFLVFRLM